LLGTFTTPSQAAIKAETRLYVQEALNSMDPTDREVLALKHFEQLSTSEIAQVLGLSKAGAGSRYLRALKRLREILEQIPRFRELWPQPGRQNSLSLIGERHDLGSVPIRRRPGVGGGVPGALPPGRAAVAEGVHRPPPRP